MAPVAATAAFPHDHSEPLDQRTVPTSSGARPYIEMLNWIAVPSLTGCPATAAPIGRTSDNLPVGVEITGPMWEDATPIKFAELLSEEIGCFTAPPGYR